MQLESTQKETTYTIYVQLRVRGCFYYMYDTQTYQRHHLITYTTTIDRLITILK